MKSVHAKTRHEAMNLSVVMMHSIIDSITSALSLPLQQFDPKSNASTMASSIWFNKTAFDVTNLIKKGFYFIWITWSVEREMNGYIDIQNLQHYMEQTESCTR